MGDTNTFTTTKKGDPGSDDSVIRAQTAVRQYPHSDIEVGMNVCPPEFRNESNDRLCKFGRRVTYLVNQYNKNKSNNNSDDDTEGLLLLRSSLQLLMEECQILLNIRQSKFQVPTVRFGKTNIQMPIITLGCMRFQQEWGPRITQMNQVHSDCQDNLVAILQQSIVQYGMVHIETARGYGCSELQLGVALQQLYQNNNNNIQRSDLIIQTKIAPNPDPVSFREAIETSMRLLQIDYIDLFALHGMNYEEQYEWVFGQNGNNNMNIVQEYVAAGKIRHVGFSTHGSTEFIMKCINTDMFEYVNLHYHYFGSYTASGLGHDGKGNLDCIQLLAEKDIGRFIISPFDKGGRLYAPSKQLLHLTLPEMEPMTFASLWSWNHHTLYSESTKTSLQLHTYTVGAARPSDLDQPIMAAYLHATTPSDIMMTQLKRVTARLEAAKELALGKEWLSTCYQGLIKNTESKYLVEHNQIIWIYNTIKAFGMYEFGKARYKSFEGNDSKWDETKTNEENIAVIGKNSWGFVPGRPLKRTLDYMKDDLINVPETTRVQIKAAEEFVYKWCRYRSLDDTMGNDTDDGNNNINNKKENKSFIRRSIQALKKGPTTTTTTDQETMDTDGTTDSLQVEAIPDEWQTAYDLRPWPDFPDRPSRA